MRTTEELLEDLEVLAGHLEAAGPIGFAMSVREARAEIKRLREENVARRKKAEARVAELETELAQLRAENDRLLTPPRLRVRQSRKSHE